MSHLPTLWSQAEFHFTYKVGGPTIPVQFDGEDVLAGAHPSSSAILFRAEKAPGDMRSKATPYLLLKLLLILIGGGEAAQTIYLPWDGHPVLGTDAADSCPHLAPVSADLTTKGLYRLDDPTHSIIDPKRMDLTRVPADQQSRRRGHRQRSALRMTMLFSASRGPVWRASKTLNSSLTGPALLRNDRRFPAAIPWPGLRLILHAIPTLPCKGTSTAHSPCCGFTWADCPRLVVPTSVTRSYLAFAAPNVVSPPPCLLVRSRSSTRLSGPRTEQRLPALDGYNALSRAARRPGSEADDPRRKDCPASR